MPAFWVEVPDIRGIVLYCSQSQGIGCEKMSRCQFQKKIVEIHLF